MIRGLADPKRAFVEVANSKEGKPLSGPGQQLLGFQTDYFGSSGKIRTYNPSVYRQDRTRAHNTLTVTRSIPPSWQFPSSPEYKASSVGVQGWLR
jgi:hypothetical protein